MRAWIEVTGDVEVQRAIERQGKAGVLATRRVINSVLRRMVPLARVLAPQGATGKLARSVRISSARYNPRTGEISGALVAGGAPLAKGRKTNGPAIYALPQEAGVARVGTGGASVTLHHTQGQSPFALPPFQTLAPNAGDEILNALDEEVHRAL